MGRRDQRELPEELVSRMRIKGQVVVIQVHREEA